MQREESIDAQVRACTEYAAHKDITIIGIYKDEAVSGKTANRSQYQKMLRDCQKGTFEIILIHKYDRIGRNLGEHVNLTAKLDKLGVQLIAVSQDFGSSAESKIMRTLMWSLSEYYIDNLAAETRKGMKENALKALHNGGVAPFGYDVIDKHYVINELEAEYVRRMFDAALHRRGFGELIKELSERGITGKRGKKIQYSQIYEILRNEKYTGCYVYCEVEEKERIKRRTKPNAIRIENALPVIIDKAVFDEVQIIMNERKQTGRKNIKYLCSGLVYCQCGAKMHGNRSTKQGYEYFYYICSKKCGAPGVNMEDIDKAAAEYLEELLSEENQNKIYLAMRNYKGSEKERIDSFKAMIRKKIAEKETAYNNLLANLSSGALPAAVVSDIGKEMEALKDQIEELKNTEPPKDYSMEAVKSWLSSLRSAPTAENIHLLIERIDVKEKNAFSIQSTLNTFLSKNGWGSAQHSLPTILFYYEFKGKK